MKKNVVLKYTETNSGTIGVLGNIMTESHGSKGSFFLISCILLVVEYRSFVIGVC